MTVTKDQILTSLPSLAKADLEAIVATASSLINARTGAIEQGAGTLPAIIFDAISSAANVTMPYTKLTPALKTMLSDKTGGLECYLNANFKGWDTNRVGQVAFIRMLVGLIADDLKSREILVSIKTCIMNIGIIPVLVENQFPDYIANGMTSFITKKFW